MPVKVDSDGLNSDSSEEFSDYILASTQWIPALVLANMSLAQIGSWTLLSSPWVIQMAWQKLKP